MTEKNDIEILAPRANPQLLGQEAAERELLAAVAGGRLPHAWLIAGREGIGKATLAFRFARYLLAGGKGTDASMAVDGAHPVFRRITAAGHADLLTVERAFDEERGRRRKEIAVDDVRRIAPFLHLTAAEGGWRVVVLDGADGMNRAGQNAVLKVLEEPPDRVVMLLVTERPSALLPTIRSRCRLLSLPPLPDAVVETLLARQRPELTAAARASLARLAAGSIGRALDIAAYDGVGLLARFVQMARANPVDWPGVHAFGDKLAPATADEAYRSFARLLTDWLARLAAESARGLESAREELVPGETELLRRLGREGRLERAVEVWEKVSRLFARSDSANLDRRLTMISALDTVSAALR